MFVLKYMFMAMEKPNVQLQNFFAASLLGDVLPGSVEIFLLQVVAHSLPGVAVDLR